MLSEKVNPLDLQRAESAHLILSGCDRLVETLPCVDQSGPAGVFGLGQDRVNSSTRLERGVGAG